MTRLRRQTIGTLAFTGCGIIALLWTGLSATQALHRTRAVQHATSASLGWTQAAPRLEEAWSRWDPHRDATSNATPTWWVADRLQQAVTHAGVRVVRLEPSATQSKEPALKAAVAGPSSAIAAFLQTLPQWLPGVTLDRAELVTQEQGLECRLELAAPAPPPGGTHP